jgi:hypothetical protein
MTYRPTEEFFGPPLSVRVPAFVHGGLAVLILGLVFAVERGPKDSSLYHYMFQKKHLIDTHLAASLFALSSVLSMLRDSMRGVRIRPNFVEYRELLNAMWPRVRRYRWAQIDRVVFEPSGSILVDLWDGRREILPEVRDMSELRSALERLALARAIPVEGGQGLDDLLPAEEAVDEA